MSDFGMWLLNNLPWFWVGVMIVCVVIESFTLTLTTIWFACGAFVTIFISMTPIPFRWQAFIFVVISGILLILTRPLLLKKMQKRRESRTNVDAVIGLTVPVTKNITQFDKGEVKCNGTYWPAESKDGKTLEAGTVCRIVSVRGNTVTVETLEK